MDIIAKINKEKLVKRFEIGAVVVKQQKSPKQVIKYVVIGCTAKMIANIVEQKALDISTYDSLKTEGIIKENTEVKEVLYWGDLNNFTQYHQMVYKFPLRKQDILDRKEYHFRLYTRTVEYQKEQMWLVNICSTAWQSWLSVIQKVGSSHGLLLKIIINN